MSAISKNTGAMSLKRARSHMHDQIVPKRQKRETQVITKEKEAKETVDFKGLPVLKKNRSTPVQASAKTIPEARNGSTCDEITQILTNIKFQKELLFMYREVDKYSGLLWSIRDDFELVRYSRREKMQSANN